jgi:aryl-alcohol dehydrogenase-like predicted oxidoreductase
MTDQAGKDISRRSMLQAAMASGVTAALGSSLGSAAAPAAQILRTIPSSGEKIPAVGIGTNAFGVSAPDELAAIKSVIQNLPVLGGKLIDTARGYGTSEEVIGQIVSDLGNRDKLFIATKTPLSGDVSGGKAVLDESFRRLKVSRIDLLQVHNMNGPDDLIPHFLEYKAAGKIRYIGVTTSVDNQYDQMTAAMKKYPLDFIQVDYSIGNRDAADLILPLAKEKGIAVINNVPFGGRGRSFFPKVAGKPVPDFAKEFDATTWAQFFLKYNLANPTITAIIPGTTTLEFLQDNQAGGRGRLPDAALVKKMEAYWDALG